MNRMFPCLALTAAVLLGPSFSPAASTAAANPGGYPNIVLFYIDDLGWSNLGYRNPAFETPNIDRLAREGVDFQQAYIACPTCSPSRGTLLTGSIPPG